MLYAHFQKIPLKRPFLTMEHGRSGESLNQLSAAASQMKTRYKGKV